MRYSIVAMNWLCAAVPVLLVVLFLIGSCSQQPNDCAGIPQPPAAFDHPPTVPMRIREVPYGAINEACALLGMTQRANACTRTGGPLGVVTIIPAIDGRTVTYARQACYLRHEWGHVNGASSDHSGWRT